MAWAIALKTPERSFTPSIRTRLLVYLLLPLLVVMAASIWIDHRTLVSPVYAAFDRMLTRTTTEIASHITRGPDGRLAVHWPPQPPSHYGWHPHPDPDDGDRPPFFHMPLFGHPPEPHRFRPLEHFRFRVSAPDGRTLAGTPDLAIAPIGRHGSGYLDTDYHGMPVRVLSMRATVAGQPVVISAAESMLWRNRVINRLDLMIGISDGLQLLLVLAIAMFGITFALRPLRRLREEIARQPPEGLKPLTIEPVPAEVRPLVASFNGMLVTVRDSTRAQQHFLTNAAHQLRTPLTGIRAQLDVLAREHDHGPQHARIEAMQEGIDRLAHTTSQLLALARAEPSAHRSGDFTALQLPTLIGAVVSTMHDRALARGIDLGADCRPAQVEGIYWLLHELLVNLVDNAIRHAPTGGQITVRCGVDENRQPYLEVEDDGPGIPPAERERVRERFYRASGQGQGSGLGLAIVEEVARLHQASLFILDGAEGGARMRVDFPASTDQGAAARQPG
ncbi:sensor histidine kinase [Dyella sp. A6]|uniref:sensor histidine kinase n=1 Tax=Dyella aluminiiresistens TaxID=3069105 RepID=UPI002E76110B|nr:sensor histidine kinase [Dyella sp. A6]